MIQALGDLVESCVGAIFLDTGFDLNRVWKIMLSFMDRVMSFSKFQLSPVRELQELCQFYKWEQEFPSSKKDGMFLVEAKVKGENVSAYASATNINKKAAERMAAQHLYVKLKVIILFSSFILSLLCTPMVAAITLMFEVETL